MSGFMLGEARDRPSRLPGWLLAAPFVALHLALVAVFFVPATWNVLLLCGLTYFWRMFGITAGYNRYFAHCSCKTSRVFQFILTHPVRRPSGGRTSAGGSPARARKPPGRRSRTGAVTPSCAG